MGMFVVGNAAKLYCLNRIEDYIRSREGQVSILDLGCGVQAPLRRRTFCAQHAA
jgi:hypothetical protein